MQLRAGQCGQLAVGVLLVLAAHLGVLCPVVAVLCCSGKAAERKFDADMAVDVSEVG